MNSSSQKGQLGQEPLPSKMDIGILLEALAEVTLAGESESHCTAPSLPRRKELQKKLTYTQQLLDPRWKRKRNLILARDGFSCVNCGAVVSLHVHHIKYTGYAWEAPDKDLLTLCATCHKKIHKRHNFMGHFHMSYDFALAKAVTETGEALPTLIRLFTYVRSENQVFVKQSAMAKEFGISRLTFIRHFNRLKELNIVKPDPREGDATRNIHLWRICPFLIWKGDRTELNAYLNSLPENHPWLTEWKAC